MTTPLDYGSPVLAQWKFSCAEPWRQFVEHRFVKGLGDGSLPRAAYLAYLIQDYVFLLHFSRAWAMVVVKSDSIDQMRLAAATVNGLINDEMQLHVEVCAREGITEQQLGASEEATENMAYTRYVMDAGLSGDLLDLLAALAPCVFGYGEIGLRLKGTKNTLPAYREWIDTYASSEYQNVCVDVAKLIELASAQKLGGAFAESPRWTALCKRFETATRLETGFWSMGLRLGQGG